MYPTIHRRTKYFQFIVQTAENGRQKFHFCRLPLVVTSCLIFLIIIYKQQFLYSDWLKTFQLMSNQWNVTSATLNRIRFAFFYHNIKDNKRNLCQDLLTIENTNLDLKVHALHYANERYYASDFPFKNFCKLAQHGETIRKNCLRVQTTLNHISILPLLCFSYHNINVKENVFFFSGRELKKALRDTLTREAWYGLW